MQCVYSYACAVLIPDFREGQCVESENNELMVDAKTLVVA